MRLFTGAGKDRIKKIGGLEAIHVYGPTTRFSKADVTAAISDPAITKCVFQVTFKTYHGRMLDYREVGFDFPGEGFFDYDYGGKLSAEYRMWAADRETRVAIFRAAGQPSMIDAEGIPIGKSKMLTRTGGPSFMGILDASRAWNRGR